MTSASSRAEPTPRIEWAIRTAGFDSTCPPTVPTFSGRSSSPTRSPPSLAYHAVSGAYRPALAAYACAAASIARQSLPVAIATASMPFIMPLLCVVARYTSIMANSLASTIPSRTRSPEKSPASSRVTGITALARTIAWSVRLERMRRNTRPPLISSTSVATVSHIVLTRFAPMASRLSTIRCTTSSSPCSAVAPRRNTSISFAPPPRATIFGCCLLARSRISFFRPTSRRRARPGSATSSTWIWPMSIGSSATLVKPPARRTNLAAELTAAMIEGSSTTIGTR